MAVVAFDRAFWRQQQLVAGVDEAGRGCLAGPVVVAAVVLSPNNRRLAAKVDDSKLLSAPVREQLYEEIVASAIEWKVAIADVELIEQRNILGATLDAMRRAVESLSAHIVHVLIDGPKVPLLSLPATALVGGDRRSASIAAASIVAKVTRDRMMNLLAEQYPQYGFERHKGYPTKEHYRALDQWGPTPEHRSTFLRKWNQRTEQLHLL
jgi:ribonuclease HII